MLVMKITVTTSMTGALKFPEHAEYGYKQMTEKLQSIYNMLFFVETLKN